MARDLLGFLAREPVMCVNQHGRDHEDHRDYECNYSYSNRIHSTQHATNVAPKRPFLG